MRKKKYRPVTENEITILIKNGCHAEDWNNVFFTSGTDPEKIRNVTFQGTVKIGEGCEISNVPGGLCNLEIGKKVIIKNTGSISCSREPVFGNGMEVNVLNEAGGRELRITSETSAQIAYLTVMYGEKKDLQKSLNRIVDKFCEERKRNGGFIGNGCEIINCGEIRDVYIGPFTFINGAWQLKNGTIESSEDASVFINQGVIAQDFIIQKGAEITNGATISMSLIGEGVYIGNQFSSENSVFFANSEGFQSEACFLLAGPFSVTHHKSTLLLALFTSFFNAGSGTNQSNHMYKLGPVHQGILERGCKTGSSSYLLLPSRIGAFSIITGIHRTNFDTSDFPFSYVNTEKDKSVLVPAMNLFNSGTFRDMEKWRNRERRCSCEKLDIINYNAFSPYTAQKIMKAAGILKELYENAEREQDYVPWKGINIKRLLLKRCARYYRLALDKYLGDVLIRKIEKESPETLPDMLRSAVSKTSPHDLWIDVCGMLCRKKRIDDLILSVCSGKTDSFNKLHTQLNKIHASYDDDEWKWFLAQYKDMKGRDLAHESGKSLCEFVTKWKASSVKLLSMVLRDAEKEFSEKAMYGYGIDGNVREDFQAVRGTFEENSFVKKLKKKIENVEKRYENVKKKIENI